MAYPDERLATVNPGQPVPAELVNAHSDAIKYRTHGTVVQRYKVANRRLGTGSWSIATTDATIMGSVSESTTGNLCYIDFDPPVSGSIITAVRVKMRDAGITATMQFQLMSSPDDGTASSPIATVVSSGSSALEVVAATINYTVPDIGILAAANSRLFAIASTTGGGSGIRRLYEFALVFYRP